MDVQVLDPGGDVLPALAAVEGPDDPAVLEREVDHPRVGGMHEDVLDVSLVGRLREPPLVLDLLRHALEAFDLLPGRAVVIGAEQPDGLGTGVDRPGVRWVHGNRAHVVFEHQVPGRAAVAAAEEPFSVHRRVDGGCRGGDRELAHFLALEAGALRHPSAVVVCQHLDAVFHPDVHPLLRAHVVLLWPVVLAIGAYETLKQRAALSQNIFCFCSRLRASQPTTTSTELGNRDSEWG